MITDWDKGLTADEAAHLEATLKNSRFLLNRLETVVKNKIEETERISTNDYDSPSWAYKAADREGYIRALKYILLLTKENRIKKD
jgi:hypothetical protein